MTDYAALCVAAGLTVLDSQAVGKLVCVAVATVPQSASGLQALAQRLGVGGMTVSLGDGTENVRLWFMRRDGREVGGAND